jgi:hypothetical protein
MSSSSSNSSSSSETEDEIVPNLEQVFKHITITPAKLIINKMVDTKSTPESPQIQPIFAGYPLGFHIGLLNEIPIYQGNPSELSEYIRACEDIFRQFWQRDQPHAYINILLLSSARNRLKGPALEIVTGQTYHSWDQLKETLINNFGDQRSELNIRIDLSRMRQFLKESPVDFFNRIRSLLAILNSKISLGNEAQAIKEYKIIDSKALALKAFLGGLAEPLGSFLRSRAPPNLETALKFVKDELDIQYFQNLNRGQSQHKFTTSNQPNQNRNPEQRQNFNYQNYQQQNNRVSQKQHPQFKPTFNPTYQLNPNQPPRQFPGFQPRFGKPEQNVFAPKKNFRHENKPEPMQTSTINKRPASHQAQSTNPPQRPFYQRPFNQNLNPNFRPNYIRQSSQPRNFYSEELFHTDFQEQFEQENFNYDENAYTNTNYSENESEYFDDYNYENFPEYDPEQTNYDANFPLQASENN